MKANMRIAPDRLLTILIVVVVGLLNVALCKDKPKDYQTGKLVDLEIQDISQGTAILSGVALPIHGQVYVFQIKVNDLIYFVEYRVGMRAYKPAWIVNDPIEFRIERENKMFLKRLDGKELEVLILKTIRSDHGRDK